MREYGYTPVTTDKALNERIYQMHWEDERPDAEVLDFIREQGITPPFDLARFPQPFSIVWEDEGPVVEWPDANAPLEYSHEYLVEGTPDQLAALHETRAAGGDVDALAKELNISPPDPVRPWTIAARNNDEELVLVWHDWTQTWPVLAPPELLNDLTNAQAERDLTPHLLAAYARSKGLTPPFAADISWVIDRDASNKLIWAAPYRRCE